MIIIIRLIFIFITLILINGQEQFIPIPRRTPTQSLVKMPSPTRGSSAEPPLEPLPRRHKKKKHHISAWEREQLRRLEEYDRRREEYEEMRKRLNDRAFDEYNAKMKEYAMKVSIQRYNALLEQQAKDRAKLAKSMSELGIRSDDLGLTGANNPPPKSPFGEARSSASRPLTTSASSTSSLPPNANMNIRELCMQYVNTVRLHCKGRSTEKEFIPKCGAYFRDCKLYLPRSDPLYDIAHSFSSGVGLNLGSWEVKGVPYYPVNEEGAFGAGHYMNIPFGSWGGGYQQNLGVRDYWSQTTEIGANWYDGKYGYKGGWSVPLVQSLGVEGDIHSVVSVPTKPQDMGKPIGVDVGGGVGPYYQQNTHVGVDPWNGRVNTGFGVGVPFTGVGVNTGLGIQFPGANQFIGR